MVLTIWQSYRSCWIIQKSRKCIFEWSKEPKKRFLAIFLSLVCWIDLILHIVIELNVFQLSPMLPGHEGSFKDIKNAFLNDPKAQKRGFWPFSGVWSVRSTWYWAKFCKFLNFILIDSSCFKVWRWARCLQRYSSQRQLRSGLVIAVGWLVG